MSQIGLAPPDSQVRLASRIGFDAAVEAAAFERLAALDVEGSRAAFGRLVGELNLEGLGRGGREVVLLLLDVLQKINRRIHRPTTDDSVYQDERQSLIRRFAAFDDAEQARSAFMPALGQLLSPLRPENRSSHPVVERARAHIDQNYNHRLSLSSVAHTLHLSANYLSRVFRKETGMRLTEYLHRVRLEHAMLLLAEGERSISEIAYLVGYQNYRDFYRNFVKYENASPREVRRRLASTPVS